MNRLKHILRKDPSRARTLLIESIYSSLMAHVRDNKHTGRFIGQRKIRGLAIACADEFFTKLSNDRRDEYNERQVYEVS